MEDYQNPDWAQAAPDAVDTGAYQALLEHMVCGVLIGKVREDVQITYASPSMLKIAARDGQTLHPHGENALALVYPDDLPALTAAIQKTAASGEGSEVSYRVGAAGQYRRHIRIARFMLEADGTACLIGVLSDTTAHWETAQRLRLSEERYRIATALSRSLMIWEVDIPSHTLYQSEETSRALGHSDSVYHNVPDGLLATGSIHPSSVGDFRRMYADLYAGDDSQTYTILSKNESGSYTWVHAAFRIVRDASGTPLRSIGIVEKVPDVRDEMQAFEDEVRFAQSAESKTLGSMLSDLTRDLVEKHYMSDAPETASYSELIERWKPMVHPEDAARYAGVTEREALLRAYAEGRFWLFADYRELDEAGLWHWNSLAVNLMRHPINGDVLSFSYFRNIDTRRGWERAMKNPPQMDAMGLYTPQSIGEIAEIAASQMQERQTCSITVLEFPELRHIQKKCGGQAVRQVLFTMARLCRTMVDGDVAVGRLADAQFVVFRAKAESAQWLRRSIIRNRAHVQQLLEHRLGTSCEIACGFAMAGKTAFDFDELLKQATVACKIAQEQPNNPVAEYSAPEERLLPAYHAMISGDSITKKRVLVADDDEISRKITVLNLAREYQVDEAADGDAALTLLRSKPYALLLCDIQMPKKTGWDVLAAMQAEKMLLKTPVIMITADGGQDSEVMALDRGASDVIVKPIVPQVLCSRARNIIGRQEAAAALERSSLYELRIQQQAAQLRQAEYDDLTGLYNKHGFCTRVRELLNANPDGRYQILRWDLDNFKMVNDTMGVEAGDRLLRDVGAAMQTVGCAECVFAHWEADHFVIFLPQSDPTPEDVFRQIETWLRHYAFQAALSIHMGVYPVIDSSMEVSIMCDRALLALRSAKHSFTERVAWYDETLRSTLLEEQALSGEMAGALEGGQFVLYFQPQINYESGALLGAEALVRWNHPVRGLIPPGKFIPLFERNGFISRLDEYVWEESCRYMRKWRRAWPDRPPISVSVNISRVDIYNPKLCGFLKDLVQRYELSPSLLRLEITESAYMRNPEQLISVVRELRDAGFTVEMDDFGAGFSSLNTLKDVPVNVLKLDTRFLSDCESSVRGGTILSSIIRMAHWLNMPVIAEGVETKTQADYLKSLNCLYMQGYYFSKPLPADRFEAQIAQYDADAMRHICEEQHPDAAAFWSPSAQEALLLDSLFYSAAILEYHDGNIEVLRANDRFYALLGVTREAYKTLQTHIQDRFSCGQREIYLHMLQEAIVRGEAQCTVESLPFHPGEPPIRTSNRVKLLAENAGAHLFYLVADNLAERGTV